MGVLIEPIGDVAVMLFCDIPIYLTSTTLSIPRVYILTPAAYKAAGDNIQKATKQVIRPKTGL
jgi:hypothetical protein